MTDAEMLELADKIATIYERVKLFPENQPDGGFMDLIALRNLAHDAEQMLRRHAAGLSNPDIDHEHVFIEACDEAGCAYDNEALLKAIADLKTKSAAQLFDRTQTPWQPFDTVPKDQEVEVRGLWKLRGDGVEFTHWRPAVTRPDREVQEENETTNEYVSDNGQFGVGA